MVPPLLLPGQQLQREEPSPSPAGSESQVSTLKLGKATITKEAISCFRKYILKLPYLPTYQPLFHVPRNYVASILPNPTNSNLQPLPPGSPSVQTMLVSELHHDSFINTHYEERTLKALEYKLVEKSSLPFIIYNWFRGKEYRPTIIIFKQVLNVCMLKYILQ